MDCSNLSLKHNWTSGENVSVVLEEMGKQGMCFNSSYDTDFRSSEI